MCCSSALGAFSLSTPIFLLSTPLEGCSEAVRLHGKKLQNATNNLVKFSAQYNNLEYLFWRSKNLPVSSDFIPPLGDW